MYHWPMKSLGPPHRRRRAPQRHPCQRLLLTRTVYQEQMLRGEYGQERGQLPCTELQTELHQLTLPPVPSGPCVLRHESLCGRPPSFATPCASRHLWSHDSLAPLTTPSCSCPWIRPHHSRPHLWIGSGCTERGPRNEWAFSQCRLKASYTISYCLRLRYRRRRRRRSRR